MKKLLAIVMVVAMMFSMSVVAMADENPWTATVATVETEAGLQVDITVNGDISSHELRVYYGDTELALDEYGDVLAGYVDPASTKLEAKVTNNVEADGYYVFTGAGTAKMFTAFDKQLCSITFASEGTITITDGISGAVLVENYAVAKAATPVPTEVPATEVPATEVPATEVPATEVPDEDPATEKPADPTKAPTTPSDNNKTEAPKTADVAPIATMITLVVVAGLAIVALKKRATN